MSVKFSNNATTTLASAIGAGDTSITVADASKFPILTAGDYTYVTIDTDTDTPTREIVRVVSIAGNVLSVVRGQDGTTAASFGAGTKVELRLTAALLNDVAGANPSGEPIGHADKTQSTISFNNSTRTFTIAPVTTSFEVWCKGVKYEYSTAQTVVIPNTTGLHFIYFSASGVLSTQMSYFTWEEHAPTAYIYWNTTTNTAIYFGDERHGITLDWQTHEYLHRTRGAAIANGFAASGYTTTGLGAADADAQIDIGGGTFFDEDMQVDIVSTNSPVANTWQQDLSGPARIPVMYLSGAAWVIDSPTNFPFKVVSSVPQYNLLSGSTWSTASVTNNSYFVSWILATNNLTYPVISIISQAPTNQLSVAEAMTFEGLNLNGFPSVEFRPLYKVIYQYKDNFANSVKSSTVAVYDLRSISSAGVAAALVQDHGNLSGLTDDDHPQYVHTSEVRTPSAAVKNSFFPSQVGQTGKFLSTDGTNTVWEPPPSGSLSFTGDVTGSGSTGSSVAMTLAASGVVAGQYTKVTVDAKGRVTAATSITSSDVTTALGYTPYNATNPAGYLASTTAASTYQTILVSGTSIKTVNGQSVLGSGNIQIDGGVTSFNTRTGAVTLTSGDVTSALGYTPYNSTNPSGYITSSSLSSYLPLSGGTLTGASTVSVSTWEKWTLETTGVTAKARQGSDTNGLNFTSNARWTGSAWAEDDTARKKFAYIQHLGNGRHEFRTSPTGAGVSWTTSLTVDESAVNSTVALQQGGNQVLHAGNYTSYSPSLTGTGASGTWGINITGNSATTSQRNFGSDIATTGQGRFTGWYDGGSGNNALALEVGVSGGAGYVISYNRGTSAYATLALAGTNIQLNTQGGTLTAGGNVILHAGNYTSGYFKTINGSSITGTGDITVSGSDPTKLPLTGGTLTGELSISTGNVNQLRLIAPGGTQSLWVRAGYDSDGSSAVSSPTNVVFWSSGNSSGSFSFVSGNSKVLAVGGGAVNSLVALQQSGNQVLHAGNYTSYSPSLTGSGASGTWGISITGSAAQLGGVTASNYFRTDGTYPNSDMNTPVEGYWHVTNAATGLPEGYYGHRWDYDHLNNGQWIAQFYSPTSGDPGLWFRQRRDYSWQTWRKFLDSSNYSSYALPLSGGTVTGYTNFNVGVTVNSASGAGYGINLYSGGSLQPTYGLYFAQTANFGTYGAVSADWATYFTMNSTANRGWIFREVETLGNVAAISNQGNMTLRSHFEQGNNIARPNVNWSAGSTSTGMVIFYLPGTTSNYGMVHMVFDIYEYNSNAVSTVIVGGHNWSTSWYNVSANVIGQCGKEVRLGFKDNRFCVVFGTSGSTWEYGTIVLRKIHNGSFYDNTMDMVGNWSATQTTTESFTNITGDLRALRTPSSFNAGGAITQAGNQVLHAGNYTSYSPTLTGSGASGTWSINITGSAGTLQGYQWASSGKDIRGTDIYADSWLRNYNSGTGLYNQATSNHWYSDGQYWNVGYAGTTGIRLRNGHAGTPLGYLYAETDGNFGLLNNAGAWAVRVYPSSSGGGILYGAWYGNSGLLLSSANYTSYAPSLTGSGASGTWGISISGSAAQLNGYASSDSGGGSVVLRTASNGYLYLYNWINVASSGLFSGVNGAHWYPNNGTYGSWKADGTRNGWNGIEFGSLNNGHVSLMINPDSNNSGVHNQSYGWQILWASGTLYCYKNSYGGGTQATVLDSANYTNYTAGLGSTNNWSGFNYFASAGNTGTNSSPPLQAYTTGSNGAWMSFHRGGSYAVNFGLDSDNVMRIGGWSAAANRLQMDMSGNLTMAGNVTAYSDERLKKDWAPIYDGFVDRLASILAGTYTRIDSGERQAGVSAQAMRKILPEVVSADNEGTLALAYGNAAMVSAVELAKELVMLKQELAELKSRLH